MNSMNFDTDEELQAAIADEIIDPEVMADFENTAAEAGLSHEQMQIVWNWMVKGALRLLSETKRKLEDYRTDSEALLRKKFGDGFDVRRRKAIELVRRFGGDETLDFMASNGIADCPEVVSFLMNLSDVLDEDEGLIGEKRGFFGSKDRLKEEIAGLMAQKAYLDACAPGHGEAVQKVYALRRRLCGE